MEPNQAEQLENAREHQECARLLIDKYPLRATEHLLKCVVAAADAVSNQRGFVPLENLPGAMFVKSDPTQMVAVVAQLQRVVGHGTRDLHGLPAFAKAASEYADGFLSDVEAHLMRETSPQP